MNGAQFQRTGGSHHLIPLILGFRQIGTTTCQFVQCTVICRFIHSPEYRFTGIGKPGENWYPSSQKRPKIMSLVPAVSVMISTGFSPVCCSRRPSSTKMESRNVPGTVAKLAMRQPFVLFKGLTFQKLCLPGAFRPGDHHNKMLRPGLCVVHASPQYL